MKETGEFVVGMLWETKEGAVKWVGEEEMSS